MNSNFVEWSMLLPNFSGGFDMRLLDRILSEGFSCLKKDLDRAVIAAMLHAANLVVIDNVAEYHFQNLDKISSMMPTDFPNVMLPFECTFLEMRIKSDIEGVYEQCGIMADMLSPERFNKFLGKIPWLNKNPAYVLRIILFAYSKRGEYRFDRPELIANFALPVNSEGQIIPIEGNFGMTATVFAPDAKSQSEDTRDLSPFLMGTYVSPCLLALSFMHCRNVKVRTELPLPKLSKKYEKKTGRALLRYRVLQIDHIKQVLESEGHASTEGLKVALHICRGHFKTYGKDGKGLLFGKHAGTVWVPMHARGNIEEGVVVKDYIVK